MQNTDKYNFRIPEDPDFYDQGDQNNNWIILEKLLTDASIGSTSNIEKLPDGSIKITYNDESYTIYHPMDSDGMVLKEDFDKNNVMINSYIENAIANMAGINLRIDDLINNLNKKYKEIMNLLLAAAVKWDVTSDIIPVNQTWIDRNKNEIRVNRSDGTFSIFIKENNGSTTENIYNADGTLGSSIKNVRFERDLIRTNVHIAQLERELDILRKEISDEWITIYGYQLDGANIVNDGEKRYNQHNTIQDRTLVMGSKNLELDGGTYACTIRCKSSKRYNGILLYPTIVEINGSGSQYIARVSINGNNFISSNIFYSFSFVFTTIHAYKAPIIFSIAAGATNGLISTITIESIRFKKISTGIGSSPNSIAI